MSQEGLILPQIRTNINQLVENYGNSFVTISNASQKANRNVKRSNIIFNLC